MDNRKSTEGQLNSKDEKLIYQISKGLINNYYSISYLKKYEVSKRVTPERLKEIFDMAVLNKYRNYTINCANN